MSVWVYILRSEQTGRFYIGSTADLEDRLRRHNSGRSPATRSGAPWNLIYTEQHVSRALAMKRERELKSWKSRERIERLIQSRVNS